MFKLRHLGFPFIGVKFDEQRPQHRRVIQPRIGENLCILNRHLGPRRSGQTISAARSAPRWTSPTARIHCLQRQLALSGIEVAIPVRVKNVRQLLLRPIWSRPAETAWPAEPTRATWRTRENLLAGQPPVPIAIQTSQCLLRFRQFGGGNFPVAIRVEHSHQGVQWRPKSSARLCGN